MTFKFAQLKGMTDEQIKAAYDDAAPNSGVGVDFFLAELDRRSQQRLTTAIIVLTVVSTLIALAALIVTILKP